MCDTAYYDFISFDIKSKEENALFARISRTIAGLHSLRLMIILLAGAAFFFYLFNFSTLPLSNPELMRLSGGEGLLDLRLYYSAQEAFRAMEGYGAAGRDMYLRFMAADFVFLAIYGLGFALLFTRMATAISGPSSAWTRTNLLPLAIALADFTENIFIFLLLREYPEQHLLVGSLTGIATLAKQVLIALTLAVFAIMGVYISAKRLGIKR